MKRKLQLPMTVLDALHLDANEGIFFARQLEHIKAQTYSIEYPEMMAKQVLPVSTEAGPDVKTITYRIYDQIGMAKIIANPSDDLPKVGLSAKEYTAQVKPLGDSYEYSLQDMRYAIRLGLNLDSSLASTAREMIERLEDEIAWFGDQEHGLQGFLTNPNTTAYVADAGVGGSTAFSAKTADEIIDDFKTLFLTPRTLTRGIEKPDTCIIATSAWSEITTRPRSTNSDMTILQWLQKAHPGVTFREVDMLEDVENSPLGRPICGGGDTSSLMVAYVNRPDRLTFEVCQPFEQLPPQSRNLAVVVNCTARCGGVIIVRPLSVTIAEGI